MKLQAILFLVLITLSCNVNAPKPETIVSLPYEIKMPKVPKNDSPLLILLHGYGSNKKDLFGFSRVLDQRFTVVCPQAPINLGQNRNAWYNLNRTPESLKYQFEDVKNAKKVIVQFIQEIQLKHGLTNSKVFLGGFSQGAIMSLHIGLTEPELIDGVIALSGHLYPEVRNEIDFNPRLNKLKIFMSHGKQDNVLSFSVAEDGYNYLTNRGLKVDNYWYEAKHQITDENRRDMSSWISKQIQ